MALVVAEVRYKKSGVAEVCGLLGIDWPLIFRQLATTELGNRDGNAGSVLDALA